MRNRPVTLASIVVLASFFFAVPRDAKAQGGPWDDLFANSHWFVPAENLLAYIAPQSNLANPEALADQTLWHFTAAESGNLGGESLTYFKRGAITTSGSAAMSGVVTPSGQIRIVFTDEGGAETIGIGQLREIGETRYAEMQMITTSGPLHVTHWAYMRPYNGNPASLPQLEIDDALLSEEWNWMKGTAWRMETSGIFEGGGSASLTITDYVNGYFWGTGAPEEGEAFELLGSVTPEGNVLFGFMQNGVLTSLTGQISGDGPTGTMLLRSYDGVNFGEAAHATVIPEPSANLALLVGGGVLLCLGWLRFSSGSA